jgi:hypothetical protein
MKTIAFKATGRTYRDEIGALHTNTELSDAERSGAQSGLASLFALAGADNDLDREYAAKVVIDAGKSVQFAVAAV